MQEPRFKSLVTAEALEESGYVHTAQFYTGLTGLARKLAMQYARQELEDDFVQVVLATACSYDKKFDTTHGATFYTYVNKPIKVAIQDTFGNPHRHTSRYKQIQRYVIAHMASHNYYPSIDDIMKGTGLKYQDVLSIYFDHHHNESLEDHHLTVPEEVISLEEHLEELTEEHRKVIDLMIFEEYSAEEVALIMSLPRLQVLKLYEEALQAFKESIYGNTYST